MILGGRRRARPVNRKGPEYDTPLLGLLGRLQASVDQAKADREAARTVVCDRPGVHPAHTYVATAKSGIDFHCPGRTV